MVYFILKKYCERICALIFALSIGTYILAEVNDGPVISPPEEAQIETWDWYENPLTGSFQDRRTLDVALFGDSIYFRLYDYGSRVGPIEQPFAVNSWVGCEKKDGKLFIKRAPKLMSYKLNDQSMPDYSSLVTYKYFNSCHYWTESYAEGSRNSSYIVKTLTEDIVFDYDSQKKWVHNPSCPIWVSDYIDDEAGWSGDMPVWPTPIYLDFELMYAPEGPLTPQAPEFYLESCPFYNQKYLILTGNIFSKEGPAMHYYQLYFRIYIDGKLYEYRYQDGEPETDIWWQYGGKSIKNGGHLLHYTHIPFDEALFKRSFNNTYAVLVYKYEDGSEVVSEPAPLVDVSGVDEVFREDVDATNAPVYDLSGRIVRPDKLAPGIYIRNGKKFMVRHKMSRNNN